MQNGSVSNDNVISLFADGKKAESKKPAKTADEDLSFAEVMRRNAENQDRMRREREKANRGVIRSYRLLTDKR